MWTIGPSLIHGHGVFAVSVIPRGTVIGLAHIYSPAIGPPTELYVRNTFGQIVRVEPPLDGWAATRLGRYYNHSETPNAASLPGADERSRWLVAIRDLPPGEEITADYRGWAEGYQSEREWLTA